MKQNISYIAPYTSTDSMLYLQQMWRILWEPILH